MKQYTKHIYLSHKQIYKDMSKKQSLKLALSFKENVRDLEIYNFLIEEIKNSIGISSYIKMLIDEDMKKRKNNK